MWCAGAEPATAVSGQTATIRGGLGRPCSALSVAVVVLVGVASQVPASARGRLPEGKGQESFAQNLRAPLAYFLDSRSDAEEAVREIGELIERGVVEIAGIVGRERQAAARQLIRANVLDNLYGKMRLKSAATGRFPLAREEVLGSVVGYEIFKLSSFLKSGVVPKRYFGFLDGKWDTADREMTLLRVTRRTGEVINDPQIARERFVAVSDLELLVTYLSEGGALFFRKRETAPGVEDPTRIHLYYDLGCDNIWLALHRYPSLVTSIDENLGTNLGAYRVTSFTNEVGDTCRGINQYVSFQESIAAMGLMYLHCKELAARDLARQRTRPGTDWSTFDLGALPLDAQLIVTLYHYNTGHLPERATVQRIQTLSTIEYLNEVSRQRPRGKPPLPVPSSPVTAFEQVAEHGYPTQPSSWHGAYNTMQRYGAFVALRRFMDIFDEHGNWTGARGTTTGPSGKDS